VNNESGTASVEGAVFPHWITQKTVRASGTFTTAGDGAVALQLTQVGQGMTAHETWTTTLTEMPSETSAGGNAK
jgi:hypothetical protein